MTDIINTNSDNADKNIQVVTQIPAESTTTVKVSQEIANPTNLKTENIIDNVKPEDIIINPKNIVLGPKNLEEYYGARLQAEGEPLKSEGDTIFDIKTEGLPILQYLSTLEGQETVFAPNILLDNFLTLFNASGIGRRIGWNTNINTTERSFFRPGITNIIPVVEHGEKGDGEAKPNIDKKLLPGTVTPGANIITAQGVAKKVQEHLQEQWDDLIQSNVEYFQYGGPIHLENAQDPLVIKGSLDVLANDSETYVSTNGLEYEKINLERGGIKNYFEPFRQQIELEINNTNIRDLIKFLFNSPTKSSLCGTIIPEQVKMLLYIDAASTGYDNLENINSNSRNPYIMDKTAAIASYRVDRGFIQKSATPRIVYASLSQYIHYQRDRTIPDIAYRNLQWHFIPIKYSWLSKGTKAGLILKSLLNFPYPLVSYQYTGVRARIDIQPDGSYFDTYRRVDFEPLASRVVIDGHEHICFVIVDAPNDTVWNPNVGGYERGTFRLEDQGCIYHPGNLVFGPDNTADAYNNDAADFLVDWLNRTTARMTDGFIPLLSIYKILESWEISCSLFKFVAMLTAMPWTLFVNRENNYPNAQLCNLLPFINVSQGSYHFSLPEMDFQQRCFKLLGFIKQRKVQYFSGLDHVTYNRMMYVNRLILGSCCAQLISGKDNDVPTMIQHQDAVQPLSEFYEQRRRDFVIAFEKLFIRSTMTLNKGLTNTRALGVFKYVVPYTLPPLMLGNAQNDCASEYCNVNDWLVFMSNKIDAPPNRFIQPNEEIVKKFGSLISPQQGQFVAMIAKSDRESINNVRALFNDMWGRTSYFRGPIEGITRYARARFDLTNYDQVPSPIYAVSQFTWNADLNAEIVTFSYSTLGEQMNFIRVLDYVMNITNWRRLLPVTLKWTRPCLEFANYITVQPWDKVVSVPNDQYEMVLPFSAINC